MEDIIYIRCTRNGGRFLFLRGRSADYDYSLQIWQIIRTSAYVEYELRLKPRIRSDSAWGDSNSNEMLRHYDNHNRSSNGCRERREMTWYFLLILVMTFLGASASLFLKKASGRGGVFRLATDFNFYLGGMLYLMAAVLNIIVLRELDYSLVLPLTSITYIWTLILSCYVLKERITKKKIYGVAFIVIGAICISV